MKNVFFILGLFLSVEAIAVDYSGCIPKFKTVEGEGFELNSNGDLLVAEGKKTADGFEVVKESQGRPEVLRPKETYVLKQKNGRPVELIYRNSELAFKKEIILQFEYRNDACFLNRIVITPDVIRAKDSKKFVKYDFRFCSKLLQAGPGGADSDGRSRAVEIVDAFEKELKAQDLNYYWFRKGTDLGKKFDFAKEAIADCVEFRKKYQTPAD